MKNNTNTKAIDCLNKFAMTVNPSHHSVLSKNLQQETLQLQNAWGHYKHSFLNSYLVQSVEDPRINIQSVLTRHFLLKEVLGDLYDDVMEHEIRFALTANWLLDILSSSSAHRAHNEIADVLCALLDDSKSPEVEVPQFLEDSFAMPDLSDYIESLLNAALSVDLKEGLTDEYLNIFMLVWKRILDGEQDERISVLEPACGSANDYRFFDDSGLSRFLNYTGFDLCEKNIANAQKVFPDISFDVGNAFEIPSCENAHTFCFVHDLFEHLSPEGLERTVLEICRVTSRKICLHFFNMADIPQHQIHPTERYHRNLLSVLQMRQLIEPFSNSIEIIHIDSFLRDKFGYSDTHNKEAYTWIVELK